MPDPDNLITFQPAELRARRKLHDRHALKDTKMAPHRVTLGNLSAW